MERDNKMATLKRLQEAVDGIRKELGLSAPGDVLYLAALNPTDDEAVVVEADGFGGAITRLVEGNYPIDFVVNQEEVFESEEEACEAAERAVMDGTAQSLHCGE